MKRGSALCICGHWSDKHHECIDDTCQHEAFHVVCGLCDCTYFQTDEAEMRERENEARQLDWDARRGK